MLFNLLILSAQSREIYQINGSVLDIKGESLIGATIVNISTGKGDVTKLDGTFSIPVSLNDTIEVSSLGYITQKVVVNNPSLVLQIIMIENSNLLDAVVVIGYGQVKKGDVTGALTTIKPDELNRGFQMTAQDALIGKVAGVNLVPGNGAPGSVGTIRVRMGASLSASNDPLIVIDGIPVSNGSPLSSINPNDIESFTVLKDASATAIYGSRASNGVIIITTKRGSAFPSKMKVDYSSNLSASQIPEYYNVLSPTDFRRVFKESANGPVGYELGSANTDWQKEVFRIGYGMEHNLSLSGNTKNVPYRISVGYLNQNGTLKANNYQRLNGDIAFTPSFLDNHLTLDVALKNSIENNLPASTGVIRSAAFFDPTRPIFETYPQNMGLGYFMFRNQNGTAINLAPNNPIADLELTSRKNITRRSLGNFAANYKIHGFEDLSVKVSLGYDIFNSRYDESTPDNAPSMFIGNRGDGRGRIFWSEGENRNYLFNSVINYSKELNTKNKINFMTGYEWQRFWYSTDSETIVKDVPDNSLPDQDHLYLLSFFGRVNYSYAQNLLITGSLRADATSRFSPENRWGYFPSLALAYRLNEQSFFKKMNNLSDLKVRLSYGQTGQQDVGGYRPYLGTYSISTDDVRYRFGNEWINQYRPNGYDPNIKWETTSTFNAGLDYGFFNNRISGSIDGFKRYTTDLLNEIFIPAGSNFTNSISTNIGNMEGQGIEFGLNTIPVTTANFEWTLSGNFTYTNSTITKLNVIDREDNFVNTGTISRRSYQIHKVGETPNTFFMLKQAYDENGKPIDGKYLTKDGAITSAQTDANKYVTGKSSQVPMFYGLSTRFRYKKWHLGLNGHGSVGNYVFNYQEASQSLNSLISSEGVSGNISEKAVNLGFSQEQYFSDIFLENGSFFRIDNITLGYTFNDMFKIRSPLRLGFNIQNVALFSKYSGVDPEIFTGLDNTIYQRPIIYTFSLNLNL
ncbi:MAG TPA: SusC/RagA family TonB-linked outer membrane protein [Saprospiraceae bacterium]|nr:SusC/RagA family TonB-linked outer membrane protein [Saprospiraceae bacterium]